MRSLSRAFKFVLSIALILVSFAVNYIAVLNDFAETAKREQLDIGDAIRPANFIISGLSIYGEKYFASKNEDEPFLAGKLVYDSGKNTYSLDSLNGSLFGEEIGNLTGKGIVPTIGAAKESLDLALNLNDFFRGFYSRYPDVAWIYYTSEFDFIMMFPYVDSGEFAYYDGLRDVVFYSAANPANNPSRSAVWTDVYPDAAGKGLMVTLSSPVYQENLFMGVFSIDLETNSLDRLLATDYQGYLVTSSGTIIADGYLSENTVIRKLSDIDDLSESDIKSLGSTETGTVRIVGDHFVYKTIFSDAPWTLYIIEPRGTILLDALIRSIPIFIIAILLFLAFREVEFRKRAENQIREISLTDPLTGLKNRRYLDSVMDKAMYHSDRYQETLSLITIDIDYFKRVNDKYGHPVGDEVLVQTANIIGECIRKADVLVRLGGEEFEILLPKTDILGAAEAAEKIRKRIEEKEHPQAGRITASLGVAERAPGESFSAFYRRADRALYRAKETGRNRVVVYDDRMKDSSDQETTDKV